MLSGIEKAKVPSDYSIKQTFSFDSPQEEYEVVIDILGLLKGIKYF